MKARHYFHDHLLTVLGVCLAMFCDFARPAVVQSKPSPAQSQSQPNSIVVVIDADAHVDRGRLILGHHMPHLFASEPKHKVGMPDFNEISQEQRYILAIREFSAALQQKNELVGYSASQVHAYLADTYCSLGALLRGQAKKIPEEKEILGQRSSRFFDLSFQHYEMALQSDPKDLRYTLAERFIGAITTAGDYNRALDLIGKFEQQNLQPEAYEDHGLLRLKAEVFLALGKNQEAGLAYEDWIAKGNVDSFLIPGNALYEKLRELQRKTGHPNNIPS